MKNRLLRVNLWLAVGAALLFATSSTSFAAAIPIGFFSWDVTIPGSAGEFDIVNETGPHSTATRRFRSALPSTCRVWR